MKNKHSDFTIVSITCNNEGINKTISSILPLIQLGSRVIIQNGGYPLELEKKSDSIRIYNESDSGIYDALNKGISKVDTKYFMLLHAGDTFIGSPNDITEIISSLNNSCNSISLNKLHVGARLYSSQYWRCWMLKFGAQPPHLSCIYETKTFKEKGYSLKIPIIADFDFFVNKVDWSKCQWNNKLIVKMEKGGTTSNGFKSFWLVSKVFIKIYGVKGFLMSILRIPIKLMQTIN